MNKRQLIIILITAVILLANNTTKEQSLETIPCPITKTEQNAFNNDYYNKNQICYYNNTIQCPHRSEYKLTQQEHKLHSDAQNYYTICVWSYK